MKCKNCAYFVPLSAMAGAPAGMGECHFHPPTVHLMIGRTMAGDAMPQNVSARPTTSDEGFCAKGTPRIDKRPAPASDGQTIVIN